MKYKIVIFSSLLLLCGCNYPFLNIQNDTKKPDLVIVSFFTVDSIIHIKIEPVTDAFSSISEAVIINEVKLTNLNTDKSVYLETEVDSVSFYTTEKFIPSARDVFKLEVTTNQSAKPIVAIDSIPETAQSFNIANISMDVKNYMEGDNFEWNIFSNVRLKFLSESKISPLYMELAVFKNDYLFNEQGEFVVKSGEYKIQLQSSTSFITSEEYYPSLTSMDAFYPQSLLFQCPPGTGDSLTIEFSYNCSTAASMDELISAAHDLRIELRTVSDAFYHYKTALYKQRNAIRGDIIYGAAPPVIVPSNIENGTGIFAGYNATVKKTFIDKFVYKRKN